MNIITRITPHVEQVVRRAAPVKQTRVRKAATTTAVVDEEAAEADSDNQSSSIWGTFASTGVAFQHRLLGENKDRFIDDFSLFLEFIIICMHLCFSFFKAELSRPNASIKVFIELVECYYGLIFYFNVCSTVGDCY